MPLTSLPAQLTNCFEHHANIITLVLQYCEREKWISLGSDCLIPMLLKQLNVREAAYPFDNNLTLGPVLPWFQHDFRDFCRITHAKSQYPNNKHRVCFLHDESPRTPNQQQWQRRSNRLLTSLFNGDSQCMHHFVRTTHKLCHHNMMPGMDPKRDIEDMIQLMKFLKAHPQKPAVRATLFVVCPECFPDQMSEQILSLALDIHVLHKIQVTTTQEEVNTIITDAFAQIIQSV